MALKITTRRAPFVHNPSNSTTTAATAKAQREAARNVEIQTTPSPTLTTTRTSVIDTSTPTISAKKARKIKEMIRPSLGGFYNRVFSTENLQIGGLVLCSAAIAGAFGTWALKVGALSASQIIAANLIAFLQPGMTVVGFALKTGLFITMNAVVPVATALVTISLPIVSTVVVTTISVLVILHVVNKMIQQLEASVKSGMDKAREVPGKLLEQIPGYSMISSLLGYGKAAPSNEETEEPIFLPRKKQQRNATENTPKNTTRGLSTLLDDFNVEAKPSPRKRPPAIFTRRDFLRNKKVTG
jgi:hypothetical protein